MALVTAGLTHRWESDSGLSFSGALLDSWTDQIAGLALSASGGQRPGSVAAATGVTPSGATSVVFDGGNRNLAIVNTAQPSLPGGNDPRTLIVVVKYNGVGPGGVNWGVQSTNRGFGVGPSPSGNLEADTWQGVAGLESAKDAQSLGWMVHAADYDGAQMVDHLWGGASLGKVATGANLNTGNTQAGTDIRMGVEMNNGFNIEAEYAAVLIYDRVLSPVERAEVTAYLNDKYVYNLQAVNLSAFLGYMWADASYNVDNDWFFFRTKSVAVANRFRTTLFHLGISHNEGTSAQGHITFGQILYTFPNNATWLSSFPADIGPDPQMFLTTLVEVEGEKATGLIYDDPSAGKRDAVEALANSLGIETNRSGGLQQVFAESSSWAVFDELPVVAPGRVPTGTGSNTDHDETLTDTAGGTDTTARTVDMDRSIQLGSTTDNWRDEWAGGPAPPIWRSQTPTASPVESVVFDAGGGPAVMTYGAGDNPNAHYSRLKLYLPEDLNTVANDWVEMRATFGLPSTFYTNLEAFVRILSAENQAVVWRGKQVGAMAGSGMVRAGISISGAGVTNFTVSHGGGGEALVLHSFGTEFLPAGEVHEIGFDFKPGITDGAWRVIVDNVVVAEAYNVRTTPNTADPGEMVFTRLVVGPDSAASQDTLSNSVDLHSYRVAVWPRPWDLLCLDDGITFIQDYGRTFNEQIGGTDQVTASLVAGVAVGDNGGITDQVGLVLSSGRTIGDGADGADSVQRAATAERSATDSLPLADQIVYQIVSDTDVALSSSAAAADQVTRTAAWARDLSEPVTAADQVTYALERALSGNTADSLTGTDQLGRLTGYQRTPAEAIAAVDAVTYVLVKVFDLSVVDTIGAIDEVTTEVDAGNTQTDSVAIDDSTGRTADQVRARTDGLPIADQIVYTITTDGAAQVASSALVTGQLSRTSDAVRSLADTGGATDTATYELTTAHERTLADTAAGADALVRSAGYDRAQADDIPAADLITLEREFTALFTDALGITDTTDPVATGDGGTTDIAGGIDDAQATAGYSRPVTDASAGSDRITYTLTSAGAAVIVDGLTAADSVTINQDSRREGAELLAGSDELDSGVGSGTDETIGVGDSLVTAAGFGRSFDYRVSGGDQISYTMVTAAELADGATATDEVTAVLVSAGPNEVIDNVGATDQVTAVLTAGPIAGIGGQWELDAFGLRHGVIWWQVGGNREYYRDSTDWTA